MAQIFLKLETIDGESLDSVHHDEIELSDVNWMQNTFSRPDGAVQGRGGRSKGDHAPKGSRGPTGGRSQTASPTQTASPLPTESSHKSEKPDIKEIEIKKICDKASINLFRYCCLGILIKKGRITFRKLSGEKHFEYLIIDLENIKISKFNWNWAPSGELVEAVGLRMGIFRARYHVQSDRGFDLGKVGFGYDFLADGGPTEVSDE